MGIIKRNGTEYGGGSSSELVEKVEALNESLTLDFSNSTATSVNQLLQYVADRFFPTTYYLYHEGDECANITGGWSIDGYSGDTTLEPFDEYENKMYLNISSNNTCTRMCGTKNAISLTDFKKLKIQTDLSAIGSNGCRLCISSKKSSYLSSATGGMVSVTTLDKTGEYIYEVDLSSINGDYYITLTNFYSGSWYSKGDVLNIWLE